MLRFTILLSYILGAITGFSQGNPPDQDLKNTIRLNLTPLLVTSRVQSATIGYERGLKDHQSISVNVGHLSVPSLISTSEDSPVEWVNSNKNSGLILSADYRFYFKRNRYLAPDGLYWGPYAALYTLNNSSQINLRDNGMIQGTAGLDANFSMLHAGIQLGYQFVFWKRWTLDLVLFGPGMGIYSGKLNLDPDIQITGDEEYLQGAFDAIKNLYPAVGSLIENKSLEANGEFSFRSVGYRMAVQIGYRF